MTSNHPAKPAPPARQEIQSWYDDRYARLGADAMRPAQVYPEYLRSLGVEPGRRLLDVSCGTGHLLRSASERGLRALGVDLSLQAVRVARATSPESPTLVADGEALPLASASFDYVTCIGSLEHFPDAARGLTELARVTRAGGRICVVVPNARFLLWRLTGSGTEQKDLIENPRTLDEWRRLIAGAGLRPLRTERDPWHLKRPRSSGRIARRVESWLQRALWTLLPLRHTYQFLFVAEKP